MFLKKILDFFKISSIIILITFTLSLTIDFFFGKAILNKLDPYLSQTNFYDRLIRIDHKFYHHTLDKNVNYKKASGFDGNYVLCTDNHGFKYKCGSKRNKKFQVAFLGDSFVEGLALNYEDTFVGIFEDKKKISVANLGVTSYAPSIYLSKMKFLMDNNYEFEHLILFIDISDLYDDNTFYQINEDLSVTEKNAEGKNLKRRKFLRYNFPLTNYYTFVIKMSNRLNKETPEVKSKKPKFNSKAAIKAKWSYQTTDIVEGFDEPISKTQKEMTQNRMPMAGGSLFDVNSSGFGDIRATFLFKVYKSKKWKNHSGIGFSFPTGSTNERDDTPMANNAVLGYGMQNGTGTYDTYFLFNNVNEIGKFKIGEQFYFKIPISGKNNHGYKYGKDIDVNFWVSYRFLDFLSSSFKINFEFKDKMIGSDNRMTRRMSPVTDSYNHGYQKVNLGFGFNLLNKSKYFRHHRISFEFIVPVYQNYRGIQMSEDFRLILGWQF